MGPRSPPWGPSLRHGAEVSAYDPHAPDASFHLAGARKEWRLDRLVVDAEIFAPLEPLLDSTRGLVTQERGSDRNAHGCVTAPS